MEKNLEHIDWFKKRFFEYNYPSKGSLTPLEFYNQLELESLKTYFEEIKQVLYKMPETWKQKSFLQDEISFFQLKRKSSNLEINALNGWLEMFKITYKELINPEKIYSGENELQEILTNDPLTFSEELNSTTNYDHNKIQRTFYNYWFGYFIDQILSHLKTLKLEIFPDNSANTALTKKIPEKYYALYHCLMIKMGIESNFERNADSYYNKQEIMNFAKKRYKLKTQGEGFYRQFITLDITNKVSIAKCFKDYKRILIEISANNHEVIEELQKYPN